MKEGEMLQRRECEDENLLSYDEWRRLFNVYFDLQEIKTDLWDETIRENSKKLQEYHLKKRKTYKEDEMQELSFVGIAKKLGQIKALELGLDEENVFNEELKKMFYLTKKNRSYQDKLNELCVKKWNEKYKGRYGECDEEIFMLIKEDKEYITCVIEAFSDFAKRKQREISIKKYKEYVQKECALYEEELIEFIEDENTDNKIITMVERFNDYLSMVTELIAGIPTIRLESKAASYVRAYNDFYYRKEGLDCKIVVPNDKCTLKNYILQNNNWDEKNNFAKWCSYDIHSEIDDILGKVLVNQKQIIIMRERSKNKTLEETGDVIGVTRERIRQIEEKMKRRFLSWYVKYRTLVKIAIECNSFVLNINHIKKYSNDNWEIFAYFLKVINTKDYIYYKDYDVFVVNNEGAYNKTQELIKDMPHRIGMKNYNSIVEKICLENNLPKELVRIAIEQNYYKYNNLFSKEKITKEKAYIYVLEKYFPYGIHAYDESELDAFIAHVKEEWGDELVGPSYHSISAIICRVAVLCGRGEYIAKNEAVIPNSLKQKIVDYIQNNEFSVIPYSMLYDAFEDEFQSVGIDNRFALQGQIKDYLSLSYSCTRDYIYRDDCDTNFYHQITEYISERTYPVTKEELQRKFPGLTDASLYLAVKNGGILNYTSNTAKFISPLRIKLTSSDIRYLELVMEKALNVNHYVHAMDIYEYIKKDNVELLNKCYIDGWAPLYSLLEYFFGEKYSFSRPQIAGNNDVIISLADRLKNFIKEADGNIQKIFDYADKIHYTVMSKINYLNSLNDEYLMINKDEILEIDKIGLDATKTEKIERLIISQITDTKPIASLVFSDELPRINIPWNEWIVYSALNKWGDALEVSISNPQLRFAFPLVSLRGKMDIDPFLNMDESMVGHMKVNEKIIDYNETTGQIEVSLENLDLDDLDLEDLDLDDL